MALPFEETQGVENGRGASCSATTLASALRDRTSDMDRAKRRA